MFDESTTGNQAISDAPKSDPPAASPGAARFDSCRWHSSGTDAPPHCTHRDVLPMAGSAAFNADAWCPDCEYYKLRRTPRKRPSS
jgi:hypothetical protein